MDSTRFWDKDIRRDHRRIADATMAYSRRALHRSERRRNNIARAYRYYADTGSLIRRSNRMSELIIDETGKGGYALRNVLAGCVDTLVSELSQGESRAMFDVVSGDYATDSKAQDMQSWYDAVRRDTVSVNRKFYADGIVAGRGFKRPYMSNGRVYVERIHPLRVIVDDTGCDDAVPRTMAIRSLVEPERLAYRFPKSKAEIMSCPSPSLPDFDTLDDVYDNMDKSGKVEVVEAVRLASAPGAGDGLHVITISGHALSVEPYDYDTYPWTSFEPLSSVDGYWDMSMVLRAAPIQEEMWELQVRIQEGQFTWGKVSMWVEHNSIEVEHLDNNIGTVLVGKGGRPPVMLKPESMPSDIYRQVQQYETDIMREFAVNEMKAHGTSPGANMSGVALRITDDSASRRFKPIKYAADLSEVDHAWALVNLQRSHGGKVVIQSFGQKRKVSFKDIDVGDQSLNIQCFPTSALPTEPAGKMKTFEEMRKTGLIDDEVFWDRALGVPDLSSERKVRLAHRNLIRKRLSDIMRDGREAMVEPEPYMRTDQAILMTTQYIQLGELEGVPEEHLDVLREYLARLTRQDETRRNAAAPEPMGGAPPPAGMVPDAAGPPGMSPDGLPLPNVMPQV